MRNNELHWSGLIAKSFLWRFAIDTMVLRSSQLH